MPSSILLQKQSKVKENFSISGDFFEDFGGFFTF